MQPLQWADLGTSGFIVAPQVHIQIDKSWNKNTQSDSITWTIIHDQTSTRQGHGRCLHARSTLSMEMQACLHAIIWAHERVYNCISIYTDSELLVNCLCLSKMGDISIEWVIQDI